MLRIRLSALTILLAAAGLGWVVWASAHNGSWHRPFKLGLDLSGGTHLVYKAETSTLQAADVKDSMAALRDTVEKRVNLFGVGEPIVQTEQSSALSGGAVEQRLIVELPGVTDTQAAIKQIGQTPVLDFRLLKKGLTPAQATTSDAFEATPLTGRYITKAALQFNNNATVNNSALVELTFNSEGADIFSKLTTENTGRYMGIFLDGAPISVPVIQEPINGGKAVISGNFTPQSARELARNINFGALPVPISLISSETIGGTLGAKAVNDGVMAGIYGLLAVAVFMVVWYRLPGLVAVLALSIYVILSLAVFQLLSITLTAAGIAAFILSVGMAVDANVLIFERTKEELQAGKTTQEAIHDGFARAWLSIRDSNISSIITATILFWFGTSIVQGFALVFGLGVLISMFTAISVSRTFLMALGVNRTTGFTRFLFGSGFSN
jgi:protein-export membrane protein SecD